MFPRQVETNAMLMQSSDCNMAACIAFPNEQPMQLIDSVTSTESATKPKNWLFSMVVHQAGGNDNGASSVVSPI